ncbi:hypothetical protein [Roseateles terrae]|uniref:pEK499-p136 HEPN domain-containing protein n=1 Tax=Roseateles terrae TaxID=431060 RepID=A0ABR6GX91_9BURK|nr:hypothetical protein [Roseateles terrae]MBB3195884.1 hypothetical protein [Roseateles terrae]OWQ85199.1 hypothetical protein CDN98_17085 [Roseateles terrae]
MTTFLIDKNSGLFHHLNVFLIALEGVFTATSLAAGQRVQLNPGDFSTIEGLVSKMDVRVPLHGPIATAIQDRTPDVIEITVLPTPPSPPRFRFNTRGLVRTLTILVQPFYANYFEQHVPEIRARYGRDDKGWPPVWQAAWAVRNAISHNGRVWFKSPDHPAVTWRSLTLAPAHNGTELSSLMSLGDLLVLLLDMEAERTGKAVPNK